jgi:peptidoglycan hydrolase-like protein with peptidoglycan-binding domain
MIATQVLNKPVLQRGSQGTAVKELQTLLNKLLLKPNTEGDPLPVDGIFGSETEFAVKRAQELYFMTSDGIVGQKTWQLLFSQRNDNLPELRLGALGELVRKVQQRLANNRYSVGTIDGDFGAKTQAAVRQFQADRKLKNDGVIGASTWKALSTQISSL